MTKQDKPLITHENLEGTPFTITGNDEQGYFLRVGEYRLTEFMKTHDEVIDYLYAEQWNNILKLICAVIDIDKKNPQKIINRDIETDERALN